MAFDLNALQQAVQAHGAVVRVVVAATRGSTPREAGAAMLVWRTGQQGTIGGGALEHDASLRARALLDGEGPWLRRIDHVALGPRLGQCCGGAVTLLAERFTEAELQQVARLAPGGAFVRPVATGRPPRSVGPDAGAQDARLKDGLMHEPFAPALEPLFLYGAGHVGRAVAALLPPLGFALTWIDLAPELFPAPLPPGTRALPTPNPVAAAALAPDHAHHLVMTRSHRLDLDLCDALLGRPFASLGLIGSATKWARFRRRLLALGHPPARIDRITCPIGLPELGKSPERIAVGVATQLLMRTGMPAEHTTTRPDREDAL